MTIACRLLKENLDCPHLTDGFCDGKVKYCTSQVKPFKDKMVTEGILEEYRKYPSKVNLVQFMDLHYGYSPYTKHVCRIMQYRSDLEREESKRRDKDE